MTVRYYPELIQGSEDWHSARCGMLTASEFDRILTPTLKIASNEKTRMHLWEMAAQRISRYVEPQYVSDAMLRGLADEVTARELYAEHFAPVKECGFVTNDRWGFTLGCSPDGLIGDDGMIEVKSRMQKFQVQTICEHFANGAGWIPAEFMLQVQGELLVTERAWCDLISFCAGLPMIPIRVFRDPAMQEMIVAAATEMEQKIEQSISHYQLAMQLSTRMVLTERKIVQEMYV